MKHKAFKIIISFVLCSSMLLFSTFNIYANDVDTVLTVSWAKPQVTEQNGYITIMVEQNGNLSAQTFYFTLLPVEQDDSCYMNITLDDGKITFIANSLKGGGCTYNLYRMFEINNGTSTSLNYVRSLAVSSSNTYSQNLSSYNYYIRGFQVEGPIGYITNNLTALNQNFIVTYGDNTAIYEEMLNQTSILSSIKTTISNGFSNISSTISNFYTSITNTISSGFTNVINAITGNDSASNSVTDNDNVNNQFQDVNNQYDDLEQSFQNNMNDSLDQIDTNINLIGYSDFITTATFLGNNINRIVTSNEYYEAFVFMGLILGIALFIIGKRVI